MTMLKKCAVLVISLVVATSLLSGCDLLALDEIVNSAVGDIAENDDYDMSEKNTGYYYDGAATPELADDGITAAVNEVYYTKNGHLCVFMTLGNGTSEDCRLDSLEVTIYNGDTDAVIAGGYAEHISANFIIAAGGYETYTLYIRPEHVEIPDDTLETISYEITAVS